ncbi:MAG: hypothetical protein IJE16_03805 [Ruminococcus sp.]|nr:hypothetical protein [Ruminococcus sp.]
MYRYRINMQFANPNAPQFIELKKEMDEAIRYFNTKSLIARNPKEIEQYQISDDGETFTVVLKSKAKLPVPAKALRLLTIYLIDDTKKNNLSHLIYGKQLFKMNAVSVDSNTTNIITTTSVSKEKDNVFSLSTPRDFLKCIRKDVCSENDFTQSGLLGLIQYKLSSTTVDPDAMYYYNNKKQCYEGKTKTAELFEMIYNHVEESSDTIFNCWTFFRLFFEARTQNGRMYLNEKQQPFFDNIIGHTGGGDLVALFNGYEDVLSLLNEMADLHHCLANMMPAPKGFNGYSYQCKYSRDYVTHDGKGNYKKDKDMPDIYFKRSINDFPDYYHWILNNKKRYCLCFFEEYISPWKNVDDVRLDLSKHDSIIKYKDAIVSSIECIYKRATQLYLLMTKNEKF